MTQVPLGPGGEIDGVKVVGFHGSVASDRTPAMKAPLYADASGRLCALVDRDPAGHWVAIERSHTSVEADLVRGDGTILHGEIPARIDWGFIVVGRDERAHADALAAAIRETDRAPVRGIVDALAGDRPLSASELQVTADGAWAWYCSLASATALRTVIRRAARQVLIRSAGTGARDLEQAAWWLQRAALDEDDVLLACAALEQAGVERWHAVAQALLPGHDADWVEARMRSARRRLRPASAEADVGTRPPAPETPWHAAVRDVLERVFTRPVYSVTYRRGAVDVTLQPPRRGVLSIELDETANSLHEPLVAERHATRDLVLRCPRAVPKAELFTALQSWWVSGAAIRSSPLPEPVRGAVRAARVGSLTSYDATGIDQGRHLASSVA